MSVLGRIAVGGLIVAFAAGGVYLAASSDPLDYDAMLAGPPAGGASCW